MTTLALRELLTAEAQELLDLLKNPDVMYDARGKFKKDTYNCLMNQLDERLIQLQVLKH